MKRILLALFLVSTTGMFAQAPQQGFGAGFVLGAPTGISLAGGPFRGALAYSFLDGGSIIAQVDWLTFYGKVPVDLQGLNWYFGGGLLIELFFASPETSTFPRGEKSQFWLGAHVLPGLSWSFLPQWELFLEVGPGLYLFPAVGLLATGGLGVRYYF